jgi:hypothetical protein
VDQPNGEVNHGYPELLPDGDTVLFAIGTQNGTRIASLSLETGEWQELDIDGSKPRLLGDGYLAVIQRGNLRVVPFDPATLQVTGAIGQGQDGIEATNWAGMEVGSFEISDRGDLVYIQGSLAEETVPVWVDREGNETIINANAGRYIGPRISPDGSRIASVMTNELGIGEIWVMNSDGSQPFIFANTGADYNPVWTPDGETITYTSTANLFEAVVDEDSERMPFLDRPGYLFPRSWSPDGQFLAFREVVSFVRRLWVTSRGSEPVALTDDSFNAFAPIFAPQGGWIAYATDELGQVNVYVQQYPGTGQAVPISPGGGREPTWSYDGTELYYRSGDRMMAVPITTDPELVVGDPVELWSRPYYSQVEEQFTSYDVAPDGRFLMLINPDDLGTTSMTINVVLDWFAQIEERLGGGQ